MVHLSVISTPGTREHERFIFECLESLFDTTRGAPFTLRVTATDNAPGSGLAGRLRARYPGIAVRENPERHGFAANHNAALRDTNADFLVVANDDIRLLPGALRRAVEYLQEPAHGRVGAVAFRLVNPDGSLQPSTYGFPTVTSALIGLAGLRRFIPFAGWSSRLALLVGRGTGRSRFWAHDRTVPVDSFRLAIGVMRRAAVQEVGFMHELSRFGGEEAEWFSRFRRMGWLVMFLHNAEVMHYGNQTVQGDPRFAPDTLKGLLLFFEVHRPGWSPAVFRVLGSVAVAVRYTAYAVTGNRLMCEVMRDCLGVLIRGVPRTG